MDGEHFLQTVGPKVQRTEQTAGFGAMLIPAYDYIGLALADTVTEVYTFRKGGAAGTVVSLVTVVYTDSTKATLLSVTKTPTVN